MILFVVSSVVAENKSHGVSPIFCLLAAALSRRIHRIDLGVFAWLAFTSDETMEKKKMTGLARMLQTQRWDDYRYYHQSRVNQTLHLFSAVIFLFCYALLFKDWALAGLVGWLAMLTRQTGHFFFEPNGYDTVNRVSNDYKEEIKVGYNQRRKIVLLLVWGTAPVALFFFPTLFGLFEPPADRLDFIRHVGAVWLVVGIGGGLFRMIQLFIGKDVTTGLVWAAKVLTDPFHNIALYYKSPLALLRGEWIDPSIATARWDGIEIEDEEAVDLPRAG